MALLLAKCLLLLALGLLLLTACFFHLPTLGFLSFAARLLLGLALLLAKCLLLLAMGLLLLPAVFLVPVWEIDAGAFAFRACRLGRFCGRVLPGGRWGIC